MSGDGAGKTRLMGRDLREALCRTYADLLRRQRTAATPFAQWSDTSRRSHEFMWLGGVFDRERLLLDPAKRLVFSRSDPLFEAVHKMHDTARLNPYEREVLYGYPYLVGRAREKKIRGPLLTVPVEITATGDHLE
ncbi:MAG: hypothetical protein ACRD6W_13485, partial [Nitrososphaerales archaeon]